MRFEIRSVQNGVLLRVEPQHPGEEAEEVVYQATEATEVEAFADFLRYILDHYGPSTSRYSPRRIRVVIEPGDKCDTRVLGLLKFVFNHSRQCGGDFPQNFGPHNAFAFDEALHSQRT